MPTESPIDLGPDFPLTPEARRKRELVHTLLTNALHCNESDPIGGNVVHCVEEALRAMGRPQPYETEVELAAEIERLREELARLHRICDKFGEPADLAAERDRLAEALRQIAAMSTAPALSDMAREVLDLTAIPVAVRALQ